MPDAIANRPVLQSWDLLYWQAYNELGTTRTMNGVIPWTAINDYALRYEISDFEMFSAVIFRIEETYQEFQKEQESNREKQRGRNYTDNRH